MASAREQAVSLVWYTRAPNGWRRFTVVKGANNSIRLGWVMVDGVPTHFPSGRFELRSYVNRRVVYKAAGANAADAMAALEVAKHLLVAKRSAKAAGTVVVEDKARWHLRKAALAFEEDAKDRNALEAAEVYRNVLAEFIAGAGKTFVDEITRDDVLRFHRALRERGCGERTVNNKHMTLRAFLRYCKVPYAEILPPSPKYDVKVPDSYTQDQRTRILAAAGPYMKVAIQLGLMCGLRDQEIQHLEWTDILWADSTLRVKSKPHWKSRIKDSEERDLPVPTVLLENLRLLRAENPSDTLVLPTSGGQPNGKLLRMLKRLAKAHGLNCGACKGCRSPHAECQRWTLHKLRRTYGTQLLRNHVDLATVQKFLGHSDLESTMRYLEPATSAASHAAINSIPWT